MTSEELLDKVAGCLDFGLGAPAASARKLAVAIETFEGTDDAARVCGLSRV
jgi:hypothetical protein